MATKEQALQEIKDKFVGKWKEVRNENVEEFFKAMGLNFFLRKAASFMNSELTVSVDGQNITFNIKMPVKTDTHVFRLDEETEVETPKGKAKATASYENGKLTVNQRLLDEKATVRDMQAVREINEAGEMVLTLNNGITECKKYFQKQQ